MIAHTVVDEAYSVFGPLFAHSARLCGYTPQVFAAGLSKTARRGFEVIGYMPVKKSYPLRGAAIAAERYIDIDTMTEPWLVFDSDAIVTIPAEETVREVQNRMHGPAFIMRGAKKGNGRVWTGEYERASSGFMCLTPEFAERTAKRRFIAETLLVNAEQRYREVDEVMLCKILKSSNIQMSTDNKYAKWRKPFVHIGDYRDGRSRKRIEKSKRYVDVDMLSAVLSDCTTQKLLRVLSDDQMFLYAYGRMLHHLQDVV